MINKEVVLLVLNYNDSQTTIKLINEVINYSSISKIVVVDNKSTDNSFCLLSEFRHNNKIVVLQTDKNGGYGYGNNYGLKYICNNYKDIDNILICNPDVEFSEQLVLDLVMCLNEKNRHIKVVSTVAHLVDGSLQKPIGWKIPSKFQYIYSASLILNKLIIKNKNFYSEEYIMANDVVESECVPGSLLMIKKELLNQEGALYDEKMFLYGEETYLGIYCKKKNFKSVLYTKNNYVHHHSVSIDKNITSKVKQRKMMLDSRLYLLERYYRLNKMELLYARFIFFISILEYQIIGHIRKVTQK